jgi:anti-sigma factor RsiW
MIEERHVELIHAELDGELTSEQRAELSRILLASPEARALRTELAQLSETLAGLEEAAPPPELSASILAAVGSRPIRRDAQSARRAWYAMPAFRYAAVFVGGLLASVVVLGPGMRQVAAPDVSELVGTIGGHDTASPGSPVDRVELDLPQVRGAVNSYQLDGRLVVELDVAASEPIEVVATHLAQTVHFSLGSQPGASPERVIWLPTAEPQADGRVELEIYGEGRLLHRESLRTSGNR